ncbi:MAG: hypothetical protein AB7H43_15160 [Acidimicrobiia bacterium]
MLATDRPLTSEIVTRLGVAHPPLTIVPAGSTPAHQIAPHRWSCLTDAAPPCRPVIVDAATNPHVAAIRADRRIMVVHACYLALRRAVAMAIRPDEIVLIADRHRALTQRDIEATLGAAVTVIVPIDPLVARAVDAGLLTARLPSVLSQRLRPLTIPTINEPPR